MEPEHPSGNRASKTVNGVTTWYIRDAQGNTMGLYDNRNGANNWREQHLYGSSRLGTWDPGIDLNNANGTAAWDTIGKKNYELTNHLGNVMATISDKRLQHSSDGTAIDYFDADVQSSQEYYAFGSIIPGRTYSAGGKNYRYGFNGKENDNEVKKDLDGNPNIGTQQDYGMRIYDPRLGRFLSTDPLSKSYPWYTPYQFAGNTPIQAVDIDGQEPAYHTSDGRVIAARSGQLQRPITDKEELEYFKHVVKPPGRIATVITQKIVKEFLTAVPIGQINTLLSGENIDGSQASTQQKVQAGVSLLGSLLIPEEGRGLGEAPVGAPSERVINIELRMKEGWTPEQQTAARNKVENANRQNPVVVESKPTRIKNLRDIYKKSGGDVTKSQDVDHTLDLQLGGTNDIFNLQGLDKSVNRSLGSQIQKKIQGLEPGTKVNLTIKGP